MPYYRRNILVLSATIFLASFSWQQIIPFLPLFLKQLGAGEHALEWSYGTFALQALGNVLFQPAWGKLADRVGRKPMVIRAGLFLSAIYFATSLSRAPWHVAICRFMNGALTGFIPGSLALIATNTPEDRAARYTATAQTASAVGLIVGPGAGGLLAQVVGYRASMWISGCAVLFSTILVWRLVAEPKKPAPPEGTSIIQDFLVAARSRTMGSIMFAVMCVTAFTTGFGPMLTLHLARLSGDGAHWLAGVIFALPAVAFVISAHRWTGAGDKWSYERMIVLGLAGCGLCSVALAIAPSVMVFGCVYFAAGLFAASVWPSTGALICLRVEDSFRGRAYGMQTAAGMLGAMITLLAALYVGGAWGTRGVFAMVGVWTLLGALVFRLTAGKMGSQAPACLLLSADGDSDQGVPSMSGEGQSDK